MKRLSDRTASVVHRRAYATAGSGVHRAHGIGTSLTMVAVVRSAT